LKKTPKDRKRCSKLENAKVSKKKCLNLKSSMTSFDVGNKKIC